MMTLYLSVDDHDDGGEVPADDMMSPEGEMLEDKPQVCNKPG